MSREGYYNIDMAKTGALLKDKVFGAGYSVKEIQEFLHLSCPQPVYRWFKGQILPSLDHLYVLSQLLGVHMEELIVAKGNNRRALSKQERRLHLYWRKLIVGMPVPERI